MTQCYNSRHMKLGKAFLLSPKEWFRSPLFKVALSVFLFILIGTSAVVLHYYNYYSQIIDRRLSGEIFQNTAKIYATPYRVYTGQKITPDAVVARLQRAGFEPAASANAAAGAYEASADAITIRPTVGDVLRLDFKKGVLTRIAKPGIATVTDAPLPAELVTNLFDESRQKRRVVEFRELPPVLVNAIIASEDRRFYSHWGIDPVRAVGAIWAAIRHSDRVEGVSTITQQLARNFFLTADRSLKRKAAEAFIAMLLEQRLTKEQILTMYANEIFLGQRGSFGIRGYSEAAAAYFGKDLTGLTLPEAATLVGMNPAPNALSPSKYPDRAKKRRDVVLGSMKTVGFITEAEYQEATKAEIKVAPIKIDAADAPYMVDFIRDELLEDFPEDELINDNLRVYTTLDPELQRAAVAAVENGLKGVDEQLAAQAKGRKNVPERPKAQAALIVLDPHTGEIKAMVGGSDYSFSQLNRITQAFRQPGSIFKPFVYAAAFEASEVHPVVIEGEQNPDATTGVQPPPTEPAQAVATDPQVEPPNAQPILSGISEPVTPIMTLVDEPTTFVYDNDRTYEPNNYHEEYRGTVTVREALQHSLNVPTIRLAEKIGYDRVANLAQRMGLNAKIKGYPSVALGAFEVTPLEMAGAYTVFANEGQRMQPHALVRVVGADGTLAKAYKYEPQPVLSPAVTYMMTNLMQGVINSGTGVRVRALGFNLPAAGKTGTSRDGWFAGYTKDFLAIAWVGFDDNRDLNLEGAKSALPIWTDFMLKATALYPPREGESIYFSSPPGVEFVSIDRESNLPATSACTDTYEEVFLEGTVPATYCPLHSPTISETIENGVVEAGKGVGNVFKGIGKVFGGIFGGGNGGNDK